MIKTPEQIAQLRELGQYLAEILHDLKQAARPGMPTEYLNVLAEDLTAKKGCEPAFKDYRGFPKSLCISVGSEVIHGIPGERVLKSGDLLSLDYGIKRNGLYVDSALTVLVGGSDSIVDQMLIDCSKEALYAGIKELRPGARLTDVARAIEKVVKRYGFASAPGYGGHGVGLAVHEEPFVANTLQEANTTKLKAGMVLALEPMVLAGLPEVYVGEDKWTVLTRDGKSAAHSEHTVLITEDGYEVLTRREDE